MDRFLWMMVMFKRPRIIMWLDYVVFSVIIIILLIIGGGTLVHYS